MDGEMRSITWGLASIIVLQLVVNSRQVGGTIYIKADGSVFPSTAWITSVDNITYAFTGSNYLPIVVQRDNVVIDGAGYTLRGTRVWNSKGIDLTGRTNVTVMNIEIEEFFFGILLKGCSDNRLYGNNITLNKFGIWISDSSSNDISNNIIVANKDYNIYLEYSSNNSIFGNNISANKIWTFPLNYYSFFGIYLHRSSGNDIYQNNISNSEYGIQLSYSTSNRISGNSIENNTYGILVWKSSTNIVYENNLINNEYGAMFTISSENTLYHNNFVGNAKQAYCLNSTNVWDDGYPTGGNYWSDHKDRYPNAREMDESGIYDTPYVIVESNQDNHPLMNLWIYGREVPQPPEEVPLMIQWQFWAIVVIMIFVLAGTIYFFRIGARSRYVIDRWSILRTTIIGPRSSDR